MTPKAPRIVALALLVLATGGAHAKKKKSSDADAEPDGSARMQVEIDADASNTVKKNPELAAEEAAARAGMAREISDALTDVMAVLQHGSDSSKDAGLERMIHLSMGSSHAGPEQARMFRSAAVAGGAVSAIVEVLGAADPRRQFLAANALYALAIDDPTSDADNFVSLEICQSGAVKPLVKLLGSEEEPVQSAATGALSALAENPTCQQMIAGAGAIAPLVQMATFAGDMNKLGAVGTLDVLSLNNPSVHNQLRESGAQKVLDGLGTMGSGLLRDEAGALGKRLGAQSAAEMSRGAHVKAAKATRVRYDNVRRKAIQMMGGWERGHGASGRGRGRGGPDDEE